MNSLIGRPLSFLMMGALVTLVITIMCAQFAQAPPCSVGIAQQLAVSEIQLRPNPTRPIWPAMMKQGRGVTIRAFHTDDSPTEAKPFGQTYIAVALEVGWPWRCLRTETKYMANGGWTAADRAVRLLSWPDQNGAMVARDLPLHPIWMGIVKNALLFAMVLWMVIGAPVAIRRSWRRRRGLCPACGYPTGISLVCTECGAALPRRGRSSTPADD